MAPKSSHTEPCCQKGSRVWWLWICICTHTTYTHTHAHAHICTHTCTHTHMHTHMHTHTHAHTHAHAHTCIHTCTRTQSRAVRRGHASGGCSVRVCVCCVNRVLFAEICRYAGKDLRRPLPPTHTYMYMYVYIYTNTHIGLFLWQHRPAGMAGKTDRDYTRAHTHTLLICLSQASK